MQLAAAADIPVPETVQAVIAARLDTLPAERKALVHDAAVVGAVFWLGALAHMSGLDEPAVEQGLRTVAGRELLRPVRTSSVKGQAEYAFRHLLIRDVAYQQIPRAARVRKHRAVAAWIERLAGDRVTDHAEIVAHHYGQALQLARATGLDGESTELEAQARRFLVMAADRALEFDARKAEAFYRQALALCPPRHPERGRLLAKTAEAALVGGRLAEAQRDFEEAIDELRDQGDVLRRGRGDGAAGPDLLVPGRDGPQALPALAGHRAARARAARARARPGLHERRRRPHGRQPCARVLRLVGESPGAGPGVGPR